MVENDAPLIRLLLKWRAISEAARSYNTKPQHEKYKAYRKCADQLEATLARIGLERNDEGTST